MNAKPKRKSRSKESSSSALAAGSKTSADVLALGNKLVDEFGGKHDADTLSQWIAHDLAAKLKECAAAKGPRKAELEAACRATILQLWKHRASWPYNHRPFASFDAVFRALESLAPQHDRGQYFSFDLRGPAPADHRQ